MCDLPPACSQDFNINSASGCNRARWTSGKIPFFPGGELRHVRYRVDYTGPDRRVHRQQDRK